MSTEHLSEHVLDLLLIWESTGEGDARARDARSHMKECAHCRDAFAERTSVRQHFEETVLPKTLGKVRARLSEPEKKPTRWAWIFAPVAVAAAATLLALPRQDDGNQGIGSDLTIKGGPALRTYVKHGEAVTELREGQRLFAHDALRFVVWPGEHKYLVIASLDGAGQASIYYPHSGSESAAIASNASFDVPGAIELDDAPGPERLFAVLSDEPVSLERVRTALQGIPLTQLRSQHTLELPGTSQVSMLFDKTPPAP